MMFTERATRLPPGRSLRVQRSPQGPIEERFVDFVYQPMRDAKGAVTGIFVEGFDVTDAKLAEDALRASEAQFRTFAQAMPNHVWTAPPDGLLDWFNERVYEYSGAGTGRARRTSLGPDRLIPRIWPTPRHAGRQPCRRDRRTRPNSGSGARTVRTVGTSHARCPSAARTAQSPAGSAPTPTSRTRRPPLRNSRT